MRVPEAQGCGKGILQPFRASSVLADSQVYDTFNGTSEFKSKVMFKLVRRYYINICFKKKVILKIVKQLYRFVHETCSACSSLHVHNTMFIC